MIKREIQGAKSFPKKDLWQSLPRKHRVEADESTTRSLRRLSGETRVRLAAEMSSAAIAITLDSIRDQNPGISNARLVKLAHKRLGQGRRVG